MPNITGSQLFWDYPVMKDHVGSLSPAGSTGRLYQGTIQEKDLTYSNMEFDASKSNAIYKNSKLQMNALNVLACIRI